ncbi:claudin-15-like isoform X2 [Astyanax mexicanus]|uniref:Claudin n=1 Tax=Astyanax mexicanus TaxID=7994 RepID=A0A3B1IQ06_ASTMX|nr:claudin-15-like isoform X2 [Astyanax mexicanus]
MKSSLQIVSLAVGFLGCVTAFISLHSHWKESSDFGNVIVTSNIFENLWMSCAEDSTGIYDCWYFQSLLAMSGHVQASRALMIASIVLGTFGLVATLVGMQCSKIGGDNYILKGRTAALGGIFFILQGLCTMIAVSWYAFNITQEFFDPLYPGTKFELGQGLYIGWCSATLALLGGTCLLCSCSVTTKEKKLSYAYRGPTRGTAYTTSVTTTTPHPYDRNAYV